MDVGIPRKNGERKSLNRGGVGLVGILGIWSLPARKHQKSFVSDEETTGTRYSMTNSAGVFR